MSVVQSCQDKEETQTEGGAPSDPHPGSKLRGTVTLQQTNSLLDTRPKCAQKLDFFGTVIA